MSKSADGTMMYPVLSSAIASILTGTALVVTRYVVSEVDGLTVATLRYILAAGCLLVFVPMYHRFDFAKRDFLQIIALGVLYFGLFPWCISVAMQYTTATEGAIVLATTPAMTLVIGSLNGSESWTASKGFGVAFAIIGAAVAYFGAGLGFVAVDVTLGTTLMALATVLGAIYAVYSKPYVIKYSPLNVTSIAMTAGAVALSLMWLVGDRAIGAPRLDALGWLAVFYIGIAGGAVSFFLYAWALGRATPTTIMIFIPFNPIAALIVGSLWLGEPLDFQLFAGLALVVIGIFLVVAPDGSMSSLLASWRQRRQ